MEDAGIDQTALAKELGTAQPVVWRWCKQAVVPEGRFLLRLPAILNISGHWLLTEQGSKRPPDAEQIAPYEQARRSVAAEFRVKILNALQAALGPTATEDAKDVLAGHKAVQEAKANAGEAKRPKRKRGQGRE
jgi:transcriptional regulator with XRE-family HTH domain